MVCEAWFQQAKLQHALHLLDLRGICRGYLDSRRQSCWVKNSRDDLIRFIAAEW